MKWYNPQGKPFKLSGFPFFESDRVYRRLPLRPSRELPEAVYYLADETAGGQIRFHARFKKLTFRVSVASMPTYFVTQGMVNGSHTSLLNKRGFDVYLSRDGGEYEFLSSTTNFNDTHTYYESTPVVSDEEIDVDVLINFPLYGAIDKVLLGFDDDAVITPPKKEFVDGKRVVMYGMSIEQGASASRPGMCESNILSRWLNREVINLGFNSSAKCESEVAEVISEIEDVALLTISTDKNSPDEVWLDEKLREFIRIYRKKHPLTPIIVTPSIEGLYEKFIHKDRIKREKMLAAEEKVVSDLTLGGDKNLYILNESVAT